MLDPAFGFLIIGGFTLNQYYNTKVAAVGADAQTFQNESDSQARVISQLTNQQAQRPRSAGKARAGIGDLCNFTANRIACPLRKPRSR